MARRLARSRGSGGAEPHAPAAHGDTDPGEHAAEGVTGVERLPVSSSTIESIGYDSVTAVLEIQFTHGDLYEYFMVPHYTYLALLRAPSAGGFFGESIRNKYQFRKL